MASNLSLLSGDQFLCPICLDMLTQPVSTPCGHNFCTSCLMTYWNNESVCQCPICKETFDRRPNLKVNTFISELASQFVQLQATGSHSLSPDQRRDNSGGTVLCDVCADTQQEAVKSCVQCLTSYCSVHLEPHHRAVKSVQELTPLVREIQESQAEFVKVMEEKQKAAEEEAGGFISSIERELTELQRTTVKLRELRETEDQLRFLQNFPKTNLLPHIMDLSTFSFNRHLEIQHMQKSLSSSVSQLRKLLDKMNTDISKLPVSNEVTLKYLQQYEENVWLDPHTAHPLLNLSSDGKQVRYSMGSGLWRDQNLNPNMFTEHLAVLGLNGFESRKFYFEVFVSQKTEWCLGVATASVQRRGALVRSPHSGLWAIWFLEDKFETFSSPGVTVYQGKVERVGVFVDYDEGLISFYDVHTAALIYSFTECVFTEELYPYLNPCDNEYGSNLDPMVIVPVSNTT